MDQHRESQQATERLVSQVRLGLAAGLGPALTARLLERFGGDVTSACRASPGQLMLIQGIGEAKSRQIAKGLADSLDPAKREIELAHSAGVTILVKGTPGYPRLLASLPDSPYLLYCKGKIDEVDAYPVAIVGSRKCTSYGLEQAAIFASSLARSGLTIVSGGARGIDSSAHRAALAAGGRTFVVMGCGLLHCYPPENAELFDRVSVSGAVVSELPMNTPPQAENFPARNRIISGLSLGVILIEASEQSGALITARVATEEHGREVFALPGRVDSPASRGTLSLLKSGAAHCVTEPADVVHALEGAAHHVFSGTHAQRYGTPAGLFDATAADLANEVRSANAPGLPELHVKLLACLANGPRTFDELIIGTEADVVSVRGGLTLLEMTKRVIREGSRFAAAKRG